MESPDGWNPTYCKSLFLDRIRVSLPGKRSRLYLITSRSDWREQRSLWVFLTDDSHTVPESLSLSIMGWTKYFEGRLRVSEVLVQGSMLCSFWAEHIETGDRRTLFWRTFSDAKSKLHMGAKVQGRLRAKRGQHGAKQSLSEVLKGLGRWSLRWAALPPTNVKYIQFFLRTILTWISWKTIGN